MPIDGFDDNEPAQAKKMDREQLIEMNRQLDAQIGGIAKAA